MSLYWCIVGYGLYLHWDGHSGGNRLLAFFHLYHQVACCTEAGNKLSGPSAHTDHLALNYFSDCTPVH